MSRLLGLLAIAVSLLVVEPAVFATPGRGSGGRRAAPELSTDGTAAGLALAAGAAALVFSRRRSRKPR